MGILFINGSPDDACFFVFVIVLVLVGFLVIPAVIWGFWVGVVCRVVNFFGFLDVDVLVIDLFIRVMVGIFVIFILVLIFALSDYVIKGVFLWLDKLFSSIIFLARSMCVGEYFSIKLCASVLSFLCGGSWLFCEFGVGILGFSGVGFIRLWVCGGFWVMFVELLWIFVAVLGGVDVCKGGWLGI